MEWYLTMIFHTEILRQRIAQQFVIRCSNGVWVPVGILGPAVNEFLGDSADDDNDKGP